MHWQRGFKRIRLVGTGAMALGLILLISVLSTRALGYSPNPGFESLFDTFWPLGLLLIVLGLLLWLAVWVLAGFLPTEAGMAKTIEANPPPRAVPGLENERLWFAADADDPRHCEDGCRARCHRRASRPRRLQYPRHPLRRRVHLLGGHLAARHRDGAVDVPRGGSRAAQSSGRRGRGRHAFPYLADRVRQGREPTSRAERILRAH